MTESGQCLVTVCEVTGTVMLPGCFVPMIFLQSRPSDGKVRMRLRRGDDAAATAESL